MELNKLANKKILVIDDDKGFFVLIDYYLTLHSVLCDSAINLSEGKQKLLEHKYDFVLIDSFLPDGMGIEILNFMHQIDYIAPTMMLTGNDDQAYMKACFTAGVNDYILKPACIELVWLKIQRNYKNFLLDQELQEQNKQLEAMLNLKEQEEDLARHVYKHLSQSTQVIDSAITADMKPSSSFNGDFLLSEEAPSGNKIITLVDATGHGLAAAISVLPVVSALRAMARKGLSLEHLAYEINSKLFKEIPDDRFIAGIGIEYNPHSEQVRLFNAGMPDAILLDEHCNFIKRMRSKSLPLGILDQQDFAPEFETWNVEPGHHLLICSDGLLEQMSPEDKLFDKNALDQSIAACTSSSDLVEQILRDWNAHRRDATATDDVSVCCINFDQLKSSFLGSKEPVNCATEGDLALSLKLSGRALGESDVLSMLDATLNHCNADVALRKRSFTVFAELVNNALDHGVLKLDSALKNDYSGFADYLEQRETGLRDLKLTDQLQLDLLYSMGSGEINFSVADSGHGFQNQTSTQDKGESLSGRGLGLVQSISQKYVVHAPGNRSTVTLK